MLTNSDMAGDLHVFASITCVLRAKSPAVLALVHVVQLLDTLLDVSVWVSLQEAAKSGAISLFDRVCKRQRLEPRAQLPPRNDDHCLQVYHLSKAMKEAVEHGHMAIVQRIHALHPQRMAVKLLPLAAAYGDLGLLQWLLAHRTDEVCASSPLNLSDLSSGTGLRLWSCCLRPAYACAIQSRHVQIVKWLLCNGFDASRSIGGAGDAAAARGDLDMVVWLHTHNTPSSFSPNAIDLATQGGHTEIVQYLVINRCDQFTTAAMTHAMRGGLVEEPVATLKVSPLETRSPDRRRGRLLQMAPDAAASTRPEDPFSVLYMVCVLGHLDIVQNVVTQHGSTCHKLALVQASARGYVHILEWVHRHGCGEWYVDVMDSAAQKGQLVTVQWLHVNRHEGCTTSAMDGAARNGHLDVVQYLHENRPEGCTGRAMDGAAQNGHLELVVWLHTNRMEAGSIDLFLDRAAPSVIQWLHWNRPDDGCTFAAMDQAAARGDVATLDFLYENRTEGCSLQALQLATKEGHFHIIQWLCGHYPDMFDVSQVHETAQRHDQEEIIKWASDQLVETTRPQTGRASAGDAGTSSS